MTTSGTRPIAWAVLAAAVLEVVAPVVTVLGPGASPGSTSGPDMLITPVGWAFAIWGVIYALAIAQAVVTLRRGPAAVPRRLQVDQLVLYVGGAVWIAMSAVGSSLATAVALLVMLVAAVDGVVVASRAVAPSRAFAVLTRASVGLYAGWVTAAFFLNLGTALVSLDVVEADHLGWQLVALAAAGACLVVLTIVTRVVAYAAAGAWALLGIVVTGSANGDTAVWALSAGVGAALVVALVLARLARRGPSTPATA